jgi:hypothetical protein
MVINSFESYLSEIDGSEIYMANGRICADFNLEVNSQRATGLSFEDGYSESKLSEDIRKHEYLFEKKESTSFYYPNTNMFSMSNEVRGIKGFILRLKPEYGKRFIPNIPELTTEQQEYFKRSSCKSDGKLVPYYHGTGTKILAFDELMTGNGNDQYGSGFYFTTDYSQAKGYCFSRMKDIAGNPMEKPGGEDYYNVVSAYLDIKNPIRIDGRINANLSCIELDDLKQIEAIIRQLPSLYSCDEEVPNPLGDYFDEYWSCDWTPETEKDEYFYFIRRLAKEYYAHTDLSKLDALFQKYPAEYRKAIRTVLGYDGVLIDFGDKQHAVAWFPEQIKSISNKTPKKSVYINE